MANWDDRRCGDECGPVDYLDNSGRSVYRKHDPYAAYDTTMPYQAVPHLEIPHLVASIPAGYENGYPASYGVPSFGELSTNPKVTPLTVQMAIHLGSDPNLTNGSVARRGSALLVDSVIYIVLIAALAALGSITDGLGSGAMVPLLDPFLGPGGLYLYRVAGGSIFDGSPGKHVMGVEIEGVHRVSVSARDGSACNAWILSLMIPVVGWFVSAGLAGWIAVGASRDPLG